MAAIVVHCYGEDRLLAETGDRVREPQNRRVEIAFEPAATAA
jgi:flagellar motor protein MotB